MKSRKPRYGILHRHLLAIMIILLATTPAWCVTIDLTGSPVSAINDTACVGTHAQTDLGCNAKEFTVNPVFSAAPDTPPMCVAGNNFDFLVDLQLSGSNANRYDITFYTGQVQNSPDVNDSSRLCSATAFPQSLPTPWDDLDGSLNICSDYLAAGDSIVRVNRIKVQCASDAAGYLTVPYTLAYSQNTGNPACNPGTPSTYPVPTKSKCQTGASSVSGAIKVFSGAYVDVTKQTLPDGDSQAFTFSAAGPGGSSIIALTGSTTLGLAMPTDGTYNPTTAAAATSSLSDITLTDGQTARFYINALSTAQRLTINESATTNWETTATISCSDISGKGSPNTILTPANRRIEVDLSQAASAKSCTITNTKRSRITLEKSVGVRVDAADQFTVSASGGGTLTGTTSATTSGSGTSASTTFYSSPNTPLTLTDSKSAGPTALSGYISNLTCTNAFTGPGATANSSLPNGLLTTSTSITPAPGDDITCTYSNTKKVDFTLKKTWVNAIVNDAVNVTATGLTSLVSTADTASETDTGAVQAVRVGDVITIAESFTSGSATSYTQALNCSGNFTALSGNVLTVNSADTAIICTYTNTYSLQPLLSILKFADIGNADPGQVITYTVQIVNTGTGIGTNVTLRDDMSPYSSFSVIYGTTPPFSFLDSSPVSGLTLGTPQYSYDNGSNWTTTTPAGGINAPAGYNGNVTNWKIPMAGTIRAGGSFSLNYQVKVK